ncbi:hemolysin family protein [Nibricoccus sp. IMCC34717]|uniref:hemolysin family protein n=1 Tax=Nibricoccus sp. IMCC34717 TaxID=3034021 RepID=UPI00384DB05F
MHDTVAALLSFAGLLLVAGIVGAVEIALGLVHKGQLEAQAEAGSVRAKRVLAWMEDPHPIVSSLRFFVLLGAGVTGVLAVDVAADQLWPWVQQWPVHLPFQAALVHAAVALVLVLAAYLFAEALPRRLAAANPERTAILLAGTASALHWLLRPISGTVEWFVGRLFHLFGWDTKPRQAAVTEEAVNELIEQGLQSGVFNKTETDMVAGVLELDQLPVTSLMTPRPKIVFLNYDEPEEANWRKIVSSGHSYFPVFQGTRDQVLGMVAVKALWAHSAIGLSTDLKNLMVPPLLVPEKMTAMQLLENFKKSGKHIALVTDEFGSIQGLVTLIDVLEAIVGDMPAQGRRDAPAAKQREDGSWLIDATLSLVDAKALLEVETLPQEKEAQFRTLGGFVVTQFGRIPSAGDHFTAVGWRFEVVDMDRHRVDKLLVARASGAARIPTAPARE